MRGLNQNSSERNKGSSLKRLWELPMNEKCLFFEALSYIFLSRFILWVFPFRFCMKLAEEKKKMIYHPEPKDLMNIKRAIRRANRLAFWRNVCLVNSIAARWMLRRRKIKSEIYIGVKPDAKTKIAAHAWVKSGETEIVEEGGDYVQLLMK